MLLPRTLVTVTLTAALCLPVGAALGKAKVAQAEVRSPAQLCTQVAGHGKARVTPLAAGAKAWIGRLEMNAGAKVPEHRDATEEYIHVLSGRGTIWIEEQAHAVEPGSTVYMPAKAKVRFENGKTTMTAIQVFAGPAPAAKYESWNGCK